MTRAEAGPSPTSMADAGSATALTLLLGVAFVLLPVMLLVLMLPVWAQRAVDAQDAARAAALALVTANDWPAGVNAATAVVDHEVTADNLAPADVVTSLSGTLTPGGTVTATVTISVPIGDFPGLGEVGTLHYSAASVQHVDSYREAM